jgi:hypothetical protein
LLTSGDKLNAYRRSRPGGVPGGNSNLAAGGAGPRGANKLPYFASVNQNGFVV